MKQIQNYAAAKYSGQGYADPGPAGRNALFQSGGGLERDLPEGGLRMPLLSEHGCQRLLLSGYYRD